MSTSSDLQSLRDAQANLDKTLFLGRFCWYTVNELRINREDLCRLMIANGLQAFLPRPPQDSEVFRRVCTAEQRSRQKGSTFLPNPQVYANYLVRDVGHDDQKIYKRIVRETVNTGNRSLSHKSDLCTITYNRASSVIDFTFPAGTGLVMQNSGDAIVDEMITAIQTNFAAQRGTLNGYAVRELIRKILVKSNAVNLRGNGGGLYFISEVHAAYLDGLEKLAAKIPDGAVMFCTHGMIDDDKQRKNLRAAYESEAAKEINTAIDEITATMDEAKRGSGKISPSKMTPFLETLNNAKAKDKEYGELLSITKSTSIGRIKILQGLIMQMAQMQ